MSSPDNKVPRRPADFSRRFLSPAPELLMAGVNRRLFTYRYLGLRPEAPAEREATALKTVEDAAASFLAEGAFRPAGVYQFFEAESRGDEIIIFSENTEAGRLRFPRPTDSGLCLADFIAASSPAGRDTMALMAVNCGNGIAAKAAAATEAGRFSESFLMQALSMEMAEAFASHTARLIAADWGLAENEFSAVKRFSFGYPACPDLSGQKLLFSLLEPEEFTGLRLTETFMMEPEAAVSALVFHISGSCLNP